MARRPPATTLSDPLAYLRPTTSCVLCSSPLPSQLAGCSIRRSLAALRCALLLVFCFRRYSCASAVAASRPLLRSTSLAHDCLGRLSFDTATAFVRSLPSCANRRCRSVAEPHLASACACPTRSLAAPTSVGLSPPRVTPPHLPSLRRCRSPLPPLSGSRRRPRQALTPALATPPPTDRARPCSAPLLRRRRASAVATMQAAVPRAPFSPLMALRRCCTAVVPPPSRRRQTAAAVTTKALLPSHRDFPETGFTLPLRTTSAAATQNFRASVHACRCYSLVRRASVHASRCYRSHAAASSPLHCWGHPRRTRLSLIRRHRLSSTRSARFFPASVLLLVIPLLPGSRLRCPTEPPLLPFRCAAAAIIVTKACCGRAPHQLGINCILFTRERDSRLGLSGGRPT